MRPNWTNAAAAAQQYGSVRWRWCNQGASLLACKGSSLCWRWPISRRCLLVFIRTCSPEWDIREFGIPTLDGRPVSGRAERACWEPLGAAQSLVSRSKNPNEILVLCCFSIVWLVQKQTSCVLTLLSTCHRSPLCLLSGTLLLLDHCWCRVFGFFSCLPDQDNFYFLISGDPVQISVAQIDEPSPVRGIGKPKTEAQLLRLTFLSFFFHACWTSTLDQGPLQKRNVSSAKQWAWPLWKRDVTKGPRNNLV